MRRSYVFHRLEAGPRQWQALARSLVAAAGDAPVRDRGGALYGVWRSQIGRPRDEVLAITTWPDAVSAAEAEALIAARAPDLACAWSERLAPTLRPADATPPVRQGNYAFRWFVTPERHWPEFLELCAAAWPGFEAAYDSQVIGLWRAGDDAAGAGGPGGDAASGAGRAGVRSLLLTRRPNLAMWERSKLPEGEAETAVRAALSRRYDLCDWTAVSTWTLLTAADAEDRARWT